jgi:hypothetical protein
VRGDQGRLNLIVGSSDSAATPLPFHGARTEVLVSETHSPETASAYPSTALMEAWDVLSWIAFGKIRTKTAARIDGGIPG